MNSPPVTNAASPPSAPPIDPSMDQVLPPQMLKDLVADAVKKTNLLLPVLYYRVFSVHHF